MIATIVLAIGLAAVVFIYLPYRRDIRAAYRRLEGLESRTTSTTCGRMEFAVRGEGFPVLLIHGAAGGIDQGLDLAADHLGPEFQVIAPSRFGYLGTPMPAGATPATQTDALACLLDELGIREAAVMTYSAGGPSAVQLALRYPERVSALVLVSTAIADKPLALPPEPVVKPMISSDFAFWLLTHPLRSLAQRMFVPASYELSPEEDAQVAEMMEGLLPIAPRAQGLHFDIFVTNSDPHERSTAYNLEEITAPTLVVNAQDDPAANYEDAVAMSRRIPQATLLTIEEGGHMMLGNGALVRNEINRFLKEQVTPEVDDARRPAARLQGR